MGERGRPGVDDFFFGWAGDSPAHPSMFPAKKGLAQFQAVGTVHDEHTYRRSTRSASSLDHQPSESKVIGPEVSPRMEEHDNLAAERIDACQVRPLCRLQWWQAKARLLVSSPPPC